MFTGIVEAVGAVVSFEATRRAAGRLVVNPGPFARKVKVSESILVDGICLTVAHKTRSRLTFDIAHETLRRTNLSRLKTGARVNLEDSLRKGEPFGGHPVVAVLMLLSLLLRCCK